MPGKDLTCIVVQIYNSILTWIAILQICNVELVVLVKLYLPPYVKFLIVLIKVLYKQTINLA